MEIVADVVKLIFKTGLNYRGSNEDAPYPDNKENDQSTLPEVDKLLAKYNLCTASDSLQLVRTARSSMRMQIVHEVEAI